MLALAATLALALAASAAAETRGGETTAPQNPAVAGTSDIVGASARYDATAGSISVGVVTREPRSQTDATSVVAELGRPKEGVCSLAPGVTPAIEFPIVQIYAPAFNPQFPEVHSPPTWVELTESTETGGFGRANVSFEGTTTTYKATSPELQGKPFSCAVIAIQTAATIEHPLSETLDEVSFPLAVLPEPAPAPQPKPAPGPAPAALALAGPKPVRAKVGAKKWTKVTFKVSNSGGVAVGPLAFKATAPKGVLVKPTSGELKLPSLLGGQTWPVSLYVKLTSAARPKSTISLTGSAGALRVTGSAVVRAAG
jgi:hypothetical protein